ncbi:MAG TPA: SLC13 family permease [Candidatus Limnocylindria bacterium]
MADRPDELGARESLLRRVDFFRDLDRVDIARLIGAMEDVRFASGATILREGERADSLYLLGDGEVEAIVRTSDGERSVATIGAPGIFGELGLLLPERASTVIARTEVRAWKLPRDRFEQLVRERAPLGLTIARALAEIIDRRAREAVGAPVIPHERLHAMAARPRERALRHRVIAGVIALAVPAALWSVGPPPGLAANGWHIALVILGGAIAWVLEPIPEFAVALAMAVAWGVAGLAPLGVVFGGFASSSWFLGVSSLGLAASMASSGLLFRIALVLLRTFPPTHRGQVAGLMLGGVALTPLVPAMYGRVATMTPIARELAQALGYAARSRATASLVFAALIGNTMFSAIFLTGVVGNFLILELIPSSERARFDWVGWLVAAFPAGIVLLAGAMVVVLALLPPESAPRTSAAVRRSQQAALGPLSSRERASLLAVAVFIAGMLIGPSLHIDLAWVGLLALVVAIAGGALDRLAFRSGIDWAIVVFVGVLFGAGAVLKAGGVDRWIADGLTPLARAAGDPAVVVLLVAAFAIVVRLVLPLTPAAFLLALTLIPAAPPLGISGWVVGVVLFIVTPAWIVPGPYEILRIVRELTGGEAFTPAQAVRVGAGITVVALLAVLVSIPYWRAIGVL